MPHTRKASRFCVLCVVMLIGAASDTATAEQRYHVTRKPPPATLEKLTAEATAVARVRVRAVRDMVMQDSPISLPPSSFIEFEVEVVDGIKSDPMLAAQPTTRVLVSGSLDNYEAGFRPFHVGDELLLFLKWNARYQAYLLPYGPESAFGLVGETLKPFGRQQVSQSLKDSSVTQVVAEIRRGVR